MLIKYLFYSSLFLLSACTINQENRIREYFTKDTGAYSRVKDIQFVLDRQETDAFSLRIEKGNSLSTRKGIYPVFILKASNLPLHERFILARIERVTGKIDPQCEFVLQEDGKLELYEKTGISEQQEIPFIASEGLKAGYAVDYVIVSKETYRSAKAEFIPYPIEIRGVDGEHVEAVVSHPMGTHFQVRASGFIPLETLTLIHTSGPIEETIEIAADESGAFEIGLNPILLGQLGGDARLVIHRNEGLEELILDYPWGWGIEKKTWKERALFPMLFVANHEPDENNYVALMTLFD